MATVVCSVVVLGLTGTAWALYRDITAGITTTDILGRGADGGAQNILLVGVDSRTDAQGDPLPPYILRELHSGADNGVINSDTIMVLHVPADGSAPVAFSVPRDSYVDIPGYQRDKINAAYPAMKARAAEQLVAGGLKDTARVQTESATTGRAALVGAVEELTGLTVDHYAEINLFGFHNLTTAIGGVDVCLKAAVNDELSGARFPAGPQTISGADALSFVRQRHGLPGGDLSRIRRQQVFLAAVADKVLSGETLADPTRFGALVEVLQKSVVIDSGWDLLAFAQQASRIAAGNLKFLTIPTRGTQTNDRGDVVLVDPDEVHDFVEQQIAEQENAGPATVTETAPEPPASAPPPLLAGIIAGRYVVDVRNASERVGLASAVGTHVRDLGFIRGTVDNTDPTVESTVRYTGPDRDAADALAEQLGGIAVASDSEITQGHLLVMLGSDFDPAKVPALAAASPGTPSTPGSPGAPAAKDLSTPGVPCVD